MANKGAYISSSITDPALRDTFQSFADEIEASGVTISDVDPDASLKARSGRLWYNAASSNLFIFSDAQGGYVRATGESKNYHSVRIYYPVTIGVGAPAAPVVTLTWANLTQASANAQYKGGLVLTNGTSVSSPSSGLGVWKEEPPIDFNNISNVVYWSDLKFQRESGSATTTVTGTTPRAQVNFFGLVTFNNLINTINNTGNSGVTEIEGGRIKTNSITANEISANTITANNITANGITGHAFSQSSSVSAISTSYQNVAALSYTRNNYSSANCLVECEFATFATEASTIGGSGTYFPTRYAQSNINFTWGGTLVQGLTNNSTRAQNYSGFRLAKLYGPNAGPTGGLLLLQVQRTGSGTNHSGYLHVYMPAVRVTEFKR